MTKSEIDDPKGSNLLRLSKLSNYIKYSDYYKNYSKKYYKENKEERLIKIKEWQTENYDKIKKYNKIYYHKNREKISIKKIKYISVI